jgi:hypothetical protein
MVRKAMQLYVLVTYGCSRVSNLRIHVALLNCTVHNCIVAKVSDRASVHPTKSLLGKTNIRTSKSSARQKISKVSERTQHQYSKASPSALGEV